MDSILEKKMDAAIITLSLAFNTSGENKKPVILHSIRVGMNLYKYGYDADIVLSGILHDILEDTKYDENKLADEYGKAVANIVKATSFNPSIKDKISSNKDMFRRCKLHGNKALIVKCADLIDNMPYVYLVETKNVELKSMLAAKYRDFTAYADEIKNEPIFQKYLDMLNQYFSQIV